MHICRIFRSFVTPLSYGVSPPMLSSFVCFPFPSWGRRNSGFIKKMTSTPGPNAPRRSSQNSFRYAKQMPYAENFQVSSRQGWNPSQKLGKGCRNTSRPVFIMAWTSGSPFKASTMGSQRQDGEYLAKKCHAVELQLANRSI